MPKRVNKLSRSAGLAGQKRNLLRAKNSSNPSGVDVQRKEGLVGKPKPKPMLPQMPDSTGTQISIDRLRRQNQGGL